MNQEIFIVAFFVLFLIIILLLVVVFLQQKKIQNLSRPKYGFLGKPLIVLIATGVGFSMLGISMLNTNNKNIGDISVSEITPQDFLNYLQISYKKIDESKYSFIATPIINGLVWKDKDYLFNIEWEINTKDSIKRTILQTMNYYENKGIEINLTKGKTIIKAKTIYQDVNLEGELEIDVN